MAPKAAAPPPPEPAAPSEDLFAAEQGEADVSDLVEELIARAHAVLDDKAELQRSVPFAVRAVTADMLSVVRCYYTECDRGEPQLATAASWQADAEPRPAMIDTWSRGAVPVKKRAPPPAPPVAASAPGSTAGSRSQRGGSRASSRPKSREGGKEDGAAAAVVTAKAPPKSTEAAAPPAKKGGAMKTPEEERAARLAAEAREEAERLERLRSEVKGREYTYDQEGNVIVIETVNPERLPAYQYATRSGMAHEPMPEAVKGKKGTRRPPPAKTPVLRFNQPAKYEELDSIQPPLSETMTMREGVSMTQDGSLSSGALPATAEPPPTSPTRAPTLAPTLPRAPTPSTLSTHPQRAPASPPRGEPSCSPLRRPSLSPFPPRCASHVRTQPDGARLPPTTPCHTRQARLAPRTLCECRRRISSRSCRRRASQRTWQPTLPTQWPVSWSRRRRCRQSRLRAQRITAMPRAARAATLPTISTCSSWPRIGASTLRSARSTPPTSRDTSPTRRRLLAWAALGCPVSAAAPVWLSTCRRRCCPPLPDGGWARRTEAYPRSTGVGRLRPRAMRARPSGRRTPSCGSKCSVSDRGVEASTAFVRAACDISLSFVRLRHS